MAYIQVQKKTLRSSAVLTTSYVASTVLDVQDCDQLMLILQFTIGSLTSAEIKVEFSDDNSTWYRDATYTVSGGVLTYTPAERQITASGNYRFPVDILDRYVKVSVKGTGTVTGSLLQIDATAGQKYIY